jgi:hypothetical protein
MIVRESDYQDAVRFNGKRREEGGGRKNHGWKEQKKITRKDQFEGGIS